MLVAPGKQGRDWGNISQFTKPKRSKIMIHFSDRKARNRDLNDNLFVLSGQDICNPRLPWRGFVSAAIKRALEGSGDPYDQDEIKAALGNYAKEPARAENDRALTWAIDQIVTDVRYELGILPV